MRRAILAVLVGAFLLIGCGSSVGSGDDLSGHDLVTPDGGDADAIPDIPPIDVKDGGDDEGIDVPPIDVPPEQDEDQIGCGGQPGCKCTDNGDCQTGLCIEDMNGQFCADTCVESCADEGFRCMLVLVGGEPAYYCIPRYVNLCRPCRTNADCKADVGTDADLCVDQGPEGSYCGADCSAQSCPDGFFCQTVAIPDGGTSKQCVPSGAACECTDKYTASNASTSCFRQNANGTCTGSRYCSATGLTDCDANEPAKEVCNDEDDDCDGSVDEDIAGVACEIVNVWGTCPGVMTCIAGLEECAGNEPKKEECDGEDNNCDGKTDEGFPDSDQNGVPDCLTDDDDEDGIPDYLDNCPKVPNPDQKNWDKDNLGGVLGDNKGDACDEDDDNDGVNDVDDCDPKNFEVYPGAPEKCDNKDNNCNSLIDENFSNVDGDALADCVDPDIDNDSILNELDNCPSAYNPAQVNTDKPADNLGDACDPDDDEDGVLDEVDNCPLKKNLDQADNEEDGQGDVCDPDDDNDDVLDVDDNCAKVANTDQNDFNDDNQGDACDPDIDGDNELNETDCDDFNPLVNHFRDEVCNGFDDNCKDGVDEENAKQCIVYYRDADLDGYGTDENKCFCQPTGEFTASQKGDCNDTATGGAINPGAKERCGNGVDDNCNGSQNDENAISCQYFFLDEDSDGYGVNLSKCFCSADGSYSAKQSGDCDDQNKLVNPGLQEICDNNVDDNCNGSQNDENALNAIQFFKDNDFDHYGVTTDFKRLCSAEGLYAALQGGDCDDTNPFVNPGAVERCDTGKVDEDCDNLIDEEGADLCETYYFDNDHDNVGVTNSSKCLCAPTGNYTTKVAGDCNDYDAAIYPGAPEICNAADDNCNNLKDDAGVKQLCGDYDDSHALGKCTNAGSCVLDCSTGWVDVDAVFYNGCECQEDSYENSGGDTCAGAIDLGELSDGGAGAETFVVGNILTIADTDYYRVRAVDSPDIGENACDRFAFNAELVENPGMAFRLTVYEGNDAGVNCSASGQKCNGDVRYEWYSDYNQPVSDENLYLGECPCSSSVIALPNTTRDEDGDGAIDLYDPDRPNGKSKEPDGTIHQGTNGANVCQNNSRYFVVGVTRDSSVAPSCASYKLWLSNGKINH